MVTPERQQWISVLHSTQSDCRDLEERQDNADKPQQVEIVNQTSGHASRWWRGFTRVGRFF
jgi:hypothetical protein